jgi:chromosomal replication initiation ATPase DnaA
MSRQIALGLEFRPALGADDFLVGASNRDAVAWLDAWPNWPERCLVIYGPPASGKSHLVEVWRRASGARLLQAAAIAPESVATLAGTLAAPLVDCSVAVEDMGPGRDEGGVDERAVLHLLNLVRENGGSCLLTAVTAPSRWQIGLADLRSRLLAMPAVAVDRPDDVLLEGVLRKLFADRRIEPGPGVIDYLMTHMERSLAAAKTVVASLDAAGLAARRGITVALARLVLKGSDDAPDQT